MEATMNDNEQPLAGIQYEGGPGLSEMCQNAIMRHLQFRDNITWARILTCYNAHCLLLTINEDLVAIKSGFRSGYGGEGPYTFSYILELLDAHQIKIDEYEVTPGVLERLDDSALTKADIKKLDTDEPIRPARWSDYVFAEHLRSDDSKTLWKEFPPVVPYSIIDPRIMDLAIRFWENPDEKLLAGYRRLEDIVRKRTGLDGQGEKLFAQAFNGSTAKLCWEECNGSEHFGRVSLFVGLFLAYRNPRAHHESVVENYGNPLAEFLLLNHLYFLERSSSSLAI